MADPSPAERAHLLRLLGGPFAVEAVADGAQAAEAARARRPDLVLADAGLDAAGLSRRLEAEPATRAIPLLLLGGPGREEAVPGERLARPVAARELLAEVRARLAPSDAPPAAEPAPDGDTRIHEAEERGRRSAERAVTRVTRLQALTAALSRAVTPEQVAQAIVREGRRALEAAATIVVIRDGDACEVVAAEGYPDEILAVGARFPVGLATPLAGVVRTGRPVWLERASVGDAARVAARSGLPTGAALPLRVGGATIGALGYRFRDQTRPVPPSERAYLGTVAELCAQALERARLYAAEQAARAAERGRRRQAEMLAEAGEAVSVAVAPEEALRGVARVPVPDFADVCSLYLDVGPGPMRLVAVAAADGAAEELVWELRRRHPADPEDPDPLTGALRNAGPVLVAEVGDARRVRGARDAEHADLLRRIGVRSALVVPLPGAERPAGALLLLITGGARRFGADDVAFAEELGRRAGLALERHALLEAERAARRAAEWAAGRIERLQELTAALSESLTAEEVAAATVRQAADALDADGGWLLLLAEGGRSGGLLVGERCPPSLLRLLRRLGPDGTRVLAGALEGGEPLWLSGRAELAGRWPELAEADPEAHALALLPIAAHGRTLGAAGLRFRAERAAEPADQAYALSLARLCAGALERALRYEREHEVAATLQRSLLPRGLAQLPGAEIATRYVPVVDGIEVGGDWYESIELPDGRIGLAVGDVVGRGVEAAAVMGQLRSAMRAFALDGGPPGWVLERLSRFAEGVDGARAATVVYAAVDTTGGELRYACAGHPPPLLVGPGGDATYLGEGRSLPLASGLGDGNFREGRCVLPLGATLLLYSDGAIERRGESVDAGLAWLRHTVALASDIAPEALCTHLLERLRAERPPRDDVALVALRLSPPPVAPLALRAPAHARRVSGLRRAVFAWLERSGVEGDLVHDIVLACGEACANAVEHAYADGAEGVVEVQVFWDGPAEIVLRVRDFGRWKPRRRDPGDRGRGLTIMRELMDAVEVEAAEQGTVVVMRRSISGAGPAGLVLESFGGRTLARLRGELDAASAASIGARLHDELSGDGPELVVDLSGVVDLDRAGVRMIRELVRRSRAEGRPVVLLLPRGSALRRAAEVSSLSAMAPVVASLAEARTTRGLAGRATAGTPPTR